MAEPRDRRSYGRNWKKWLLIYGVVYLILQAGNGSGGGLYG